MDEWCINLKDDMTTYYYQIQCQMYCCGVEWCDFVVWTNKEIHTGGDNNCLGSKTSLQCPVAWVGLPKTRQGWDYRANKKPPKHKYYTVTVLLSFDTHYWLVVFLFFLSPFVSAHVYMYYGKFSLSIWMLFMILIEPCTHIFLYSCTCILHELIHIKFIKLT